VAVAVVAMRRDIVDLDPNVFANARQIGDGIHHIAVGGKEALDVPPLGVQFAAPERPSCGGVNRDQPGVRANIQYVIAKQRSCYNRSAQLLIP